MKVPYSYLPQQFADPSAIFEELKAFIPTGDFTLGKPVQEFERRFAAKVGAKHGIGVNSGTDAIKLGLKAAGVGYGDEVVTTANTFIATVGAINELGAKTVFVDCDDTFCMDVSQLEAAITPKTKALLPVHFTGYMTDMRKVMEIAKRHKLPVIEDACQGILSDIEGKRSGTWGQCGAFSLHPLKNLNVWADSGIIVTDDDAFADKLRLLRNHGLANRDEVVLLGYNSRLDSVQAIVGNHLIKDMDWITEQRIKNAGVLDTLLSKNKQIRLPPRPKDMRLVYHLYIVFAERRDELLRHCIDKGIECKVHYPIPLYQQEGLRHLGYKPGAFPVTDRHTKEIITFPAHQHLTPEQLAYIGDTVREFYANA